ncbi:MAG: GrpB family protein [Bacteroidota bacterium]
MKIIIEPYDPKWKIKFKKESKLLINSIKEQGIKIEHIGSTSINGLGAKPIIDIVIGLKDFKTANNHISTIEKLGYKYVPKFENEMPYRRFFIKESNGKRTHHIHLVELKTEFWDRHLRFRNHLRSNNEDRDKYMELKMRLSEKDWNNGNEYADAKSEFIKDIENKIS